MDITNYTILELQQHYCRSIALLMLLFTVMFLGTECFCEYENFVKLEAMAKTRLAIERLLRSKVCTSTFLYIGLLCCIHE
jgi:hypothetical protein